MKTENYHNNNNALEKKLIYIEIKNKILTYSPCYKNAQLCVSII